eukprot:scaffold8100_cov117-Isochrysis_galbana.AAC.14
MPSSNPRFSKMSTAKTCWQPEMGGTGKDRDEELAITAEMCDLPVLVVAFHFLCDGDAVQAFLARLPPVVDQRHRTEHLGPIIGVILDDNGQTLVLLAVHQPDYKQ